MIWSTFPSLSVFSLVRFVLMGRRRQHTMLHPQCTCEHLQFGHQLLVTVILSVVGVVELLEAEADDSELPEGVPVPELFTVRLCSSLKPSWDSSF